MKNSAFLLLMVMMTCQLMSGQGIRPAADDMTVRGKVVNKADKSPLAYATVAFYKSSDSTVIAGGLSQDGGVFEFTVPRMDMYAQVEFISFTTVTIDPVPLPEGGKLVDLGTISLTQESEVIENVEIVAERSETTFALDKKVFTVGKDLANRGGTAEEILDNVPSVTVDIDGNVSLRGSQAVRILINGRPSGLAGVGNANGLRSLSANIIEKVEVITNPSARYEAEGSAGIINIVLKKTRASGFNGAIDANVGYPARAGASANLNYRKKNFNWFVNYGLNYRSNPGGGETFQDQMIADPVTMDELRQISVQEREQERSGLSNSFRFGADYFFSDEEQLTGAFLYRKSDENNLSMISYTDYLGENSAFGTPGYWTQDVSTLKSTDFSEVVDALSPDNLSNITLRTDDEKEDESDLEYSLNYRKEFGSREHTLTASIQFSEELEIESSAFTNKDLLSSEPDYLQRSINEEGEEQLFFRLDYVHPLGEDHKWEAGVLSSNQNISNTFLVEENINDEWFSIDGLSNDFEYDENVQAGYFIYGNTINKFSFQGGLRAEYTLINTRLRSVENNSDNKRDFMNLFPSGTLNYNFSESGAIQMSYSRRIRRPRFWDLNPFFTFSDNRNFFSGNPNINPQFTDSYEIGQIQYWQSMTVTGSLFYRHTESSITRIIAVDNDDATTLRVPLNVGTEDDYGLDISASYSGLSWLRLDGNWNVFRNQLSVDNGVVGDAVFNYYKDVREFQGDFNDFNNRFDYNLQEVDNITWNGRLTARFTFWDSDLQLRANYRGPRETSQGRSKAVGSVDIGWSKDFLDNDLTLTLSVRDLFNNRRRNGFTVLDDFFQQSNFQWRSRYATLNASYRINRQKERTRGDGGNGDDFEGGEF